MPKETCKFYVEYENSHEENAGDVDDSRREDLELDPQPGEIVAARADNVLKFLTYSSQKKGLSGALYCTNYRLCFVTSERDWQRNLLLGTHDVSLTNISAIYQVVSDKVKRRLTKVESGTFADFSGLVVRAKDFSLHSFDFKFVKPEVRKVIVNTLVQMSFPHDHRLLFTHAFATAVGTAHGTSNKPQSIGDSTFQMPSLFCTRDDWNNELARQGATTDWRITQVNEQYTVSPSLPKYFVVPSSVTDENLCRWASHYQSNRLPVWSYSTHNGNFLVRSPAFRPDRLLTSSELQKRRRFVEELSRLRRDSKNKPTELNLGSFLPGITDLQASYEKLTVICAPETASDFIKTDANFYSELESTRWLEYIRTVLKECNKIARLMVGDFKHSFILQEEGGGRDLSCVVSCIVQLMVDAGSRSIPGFQELVQREWVAMGHEFARRLGLVSDKEQRQSPVFLFFLECVWRLTLAYPASFGFTDVYLVSLWDSALLGLFGEFTFNSEKERRQRQVPADAQPPGGGSGNPALDDSCDLPSVWQWQLQYKREDRLDFINPLYQLTQLRDQDVRGRPWLAFDDRALLLQQQPLLWHTCHYRWLSPVQIVSGGEPPAFFRRCVLVQEATTASSRLRAGVSTDSTDSSCRLYGMLAADDAVNGSADDTVTKSGAVLTSSYPFVKQALRCNEEAGHFSSERSASLSSLLEKSSAELDWMRDDNIDD